MLRWTISLGLTFLRRDNAIVRQTSSFNIRALNPDMSHAHISYVGMSIARFIAILKDKKSIRSVAEASPLTKWAILFTVRCTSTSRWCELSSRQNRWHMKPCAYSSRARGRSKMGASRMSATSVSKRSLLGAEVALKAILDRRTGYATRIWHRAIT